MVREHRVIYDLGLAHCPFQGPVDYAGDVVHSVTAVVDDEPTGWPERQRIQDEKQPQPDPRLRPMFFLFGAHAAIVPGAEAGAKRKVGVNGPPDPRHDLPQAHTTLIDQSASPISLAPLGEEVSGAGEG